MKITLLAAAIIIAIELLLAPAFVKSPRARCQRLTPGNSTDQCGAIGNRSASTPTTVRRDG